MTRPSPSLYEFGPFQLDVGDRLLYRAGQPVPLPPKVLDTLIVLVRKRGHIVSKDELMNQVWPDTFVEEGNLGQNIFLLRKVLGDGPANPYIRTIPKRGYCFVAGVTSKPEPDISRVSGITIEEDDPPMAAELEPAQALTQPEVVLSARKSTLRFRRRSGLAVAAILFAVAVAVAAFLLVRHWPGKPAFDRLMPFSAIEVNKLTTTGALVDAVVSPDGRYIAYVQADGGRQGLWIKQRTAATTLQLVEPGQSDYSGITFSRDGNWIFYVRDDELYQTSALGGDSRRLLSNVDSAVTLSPDGRQLAFVRGSMPQGETDLVIASADGSNQRVLARRNSPDFFRSPAWSPDDSMIACSSGTRAEAKEMSVVLIAVATGVETPLPGQHFRSTGRVAWLAGGRGLVMDATIDNTRPSQIWWVSPVDGQTRQITSGLDSYHGVSLTGDCSELVTVRTNEVRNIWVSLAHEAAAHESAAARQVTSGTGKAEHPCWTPDGRIVYSAESGAARNIWIMDADGGNQKQLTFDSDLDDQPVVSADGRYFAFVSDRGGVSSIWIASIDGSNPRKLTSGATDFDPAFAPDGGSIVFARYSGGRPTIWRISTQGGYPVQLTERLSRHPVVSPDGRLIAVYYWEEQEDAPFQIAIFSFAGGAPIKSFPVTRSTVLPVEFRWTPDGKSISYPVHAATGSTIWLQPLDGGAARADTRFSGDHVFYFDWSREGSRVVCSRGTNISDAVVIAAR